ncbi:Bifunctional purine biosynthesis protein PurH [Coemansia interrupta]|uniref:Bifunctional purine biosynthesis protein PurH n=1 Tax=Coemansia interrupta TaxID=1126814 RepID=A0A9W8H775_9FUNG|nr:Bifunctional purine biosynthesis protein PurH [Coemansia interrupta]
MDIPSSHTLGITRYQLFCVLAASLGSVNFGWNMGVTNLPGDYISKCLDGHRHLIGFLPSCIPASDVIWGIAVGSFALGSLIGAIACTRYSNAYGRKTVLMYSNVFSIASAFIFAFAVNIAMVIVGRLLVGIAVGAANGTFTTYVVEITTPKARSSLGSMTQLGIIIGMAITQLCSLEMLKPPLWRILLALTGAISLVNIAVLSLCVESPKWLIMNGQVDKAYETLVRLRRGSDCTAEFEHMVGAVREEMGLDARSASEMGLDARSASVIDVLRGKTPDNLRHQLLVASMLMVFQQASGISGVSFYSTTLFNTVTSTGDPRRTPTMAQILTCVLSIVGTIVTLVGMSLSVHFRRRTLLMLSHFAMGVCSVLISVGSIKGASALTIAMVFVYFAAFFIGSGPIPWVVPSEMTPTYAVAALAAISGSITYILIFAIGLLFSPLLSALNGYTFLLFAVANFAAVAFFFVLLPETKGLRVTDVVRVHSVGIHSVLSAKFQVESEYSEKS